MEVYFYDCQLSGIRIIGGKITIDGKRYRVIRGDKGGIWCKVAA